MAALEEVIETTLYGIGRNELPAESLLDISLRSITLQGLPCMGPCWYAVCTDLHDIVHYMTAQMFQHQRVPEDPAPEGGPVAQHRRGPNGTSPSKILLIIHKLT